MDTTTITHTLTHAVLTDRVFMAWVLSVTLNAALENREMNSCRSGEGDARCLERKLRKLLRLVRVAVAELL